MEYDSSSINLLRPSIVFVPNRGQAAGSARFTSGTPGQNLYFHEDGLTAVLFSSERNSQDQQATIKGTVVKLVFLGASVAEMEGLYPAAGQFHYFTGKDAANWRTHIPSYEQLRYAKLWDGVDLTLAGAEQGLKFLWSLKEARSVVSIRIRYEGAEEIRISDDGSLVIRHTLGELADPAPVAWQEIGGKKKQVACAYALDGNTVSFAISGAYDANAPLFIDPVLSYATYLGGNSIDVAYGIATDSQGCAYVAGYSRSTNFPVTPGAFQTVKSGSADVIVTKFSADGASLVYSTFIGGTSNDSGRAIAVDSEGCAYVTGDTSSLNFPVTPGAFQPAIGGEVNNAFLTKLSADGASLVYSTYLGGSGSTEGYGVAVDTLSNAYVTGETFSADFPVTPGALQTTLDGLSNAFVTKFSAAGTSLVYSSYLGGADFTAALAIAVDPQFCAYLTGNTNSSNFPISSGAFQIAKAGSYDAFVSKFSVDGASLVYSTYLGGNSMNIGAGIAVDAQFCASVTGYTDSTDFPVTPNAFQPAYGGGLNDAFVTKFAPDGASLIGSSYLGGSGDDGAYAIALDAQNRPYITGYTISANFPITPEVLPSSWSGGANAFVSILSPDLSRLLVSYYLGGSNGDFGNAITVGPDGAVYATGFTSSSDFPVTPGAFQQTFGGITDSFVVKDGFVLLKKASITLQGLF